MNDQKITKSTQHLSKLIPMTPDKIISVKKEIGDGYYINTFYPAFPGIILFLNEVHTTNISVASFTPGRSALIFNYCINGRCEFKTEFENYKYLTDNDLSISKYIVTDSFFYPTDYYVGFEVGIIEELFTSETRSVLDEFGIDLNRFRALSDSKNGMFITSAPGEIQKLWLEMYGLADRDANLIKLDLLKILRILSTSQPEKDKKTVYLTKGQMLLAKAVYDRLTKDISVHVSMREIAEELSVSESSLKNYFKIMFDMNVSDYMRTLRLKKAAKLLTETNLSVFDIADRCGYTNQGRFAKIFKEYYGMRPLEYRHVGIKYREE